MALPGFFYSRISTLDMRVLIVYNQFMKITAGGVYYAQNDSRAGTPCPAKE